MLKENISSIDNELDEYFSQPPIPQELINRKIYQRKSRKTLITCKLEEDRKLDTRK
jgi:hypothetical protein